MANRNPKSEKGAVIVEACIALPVFMFAIITILGVYYSCLAQARVGMALNESAREISMSVVTYFYNAAGFATAQSNAAEHAAHADATFAEVANGVDSLQSALSELGKLANDIPDNAESYLYYAGNFAYEKVKGQIINLVLPSLMNKHFGADPDKFLKRLGVEGSIDYSKSEFFPDGKQEIRLVATYKVKALQLLNIKMFWQFEQQAYTIPWTTGVSQVSKEGG